MLESSTYVYSANAGFRLTRDAQEVQVCTQDEIAKGNVWTSLWSPEAWIPRNAGEIDVFSRRLNIFTLVFGRVLTAPVWKEVAEGSDIGIIVAK